MLQHVASTSPWRTPRVPQRLWCARDGLLGVRISEVMAARNNVGIQADGGAAITSFGNNRIRGNLSVNGVPSSTPGQL